MKKNGFTLIELLAVIVILAIVALIAIPIVLNIVDDAIEASEQRSIELYASAVRNAVASYRLEYLKDPQSFEDLNIEYEGKVICTTKHLYDDKSFYLAGCKVNDGEKEYSYGSIKKTDICTLIDNDSNGKYSIGDILSCELSKSTEKFYVIENENNDKTPDKVDTLAMYNLNVGNNKYPNEATYGIQDPNAKGTIYSADLLSSTPGYGTVAFSTSAYWGQNDKDVYDERNDVIKPIIDDYVKYLNKKMTAPIGYLITSSQVKNLGCSETNCSCSSAPSWVYSTSYWTGMYKVGHGPWAIFNNSLMDYAISHSDGSFGVRPVITISTNDIKEYIN